MKFENYGPGVRFIVFQHSGTADVVWRGLCGSKMAGGVVNLSLSAPPEEIIEEDASQTTSAKRTKLN